MNSPIKSYVKSSMGLKFGSDSTELLVLDQSQLPWKEDWISVRDSYHMVEIIKSLKVRGAPLIGVAAAAALALDGMRDLPNLSERSQALRASRPTAINLMNALDRMNPWIEAASSKKLLEEFHFIFDEENSASNQMAENGQAFIRRDEGVLTHCNTGGLATVGLGTALSVPILAHMRGLNIHVYVDETRPLLQGARLNTWELQQHAVPHTLICDNMAGSLMSEGKVQRIFVGADRIALNGDFANKIGTYSLAVLAHYHRIPFYVVAPFSTVDANASSGIDIPIEERAREEILGASTMQGRVNWAPAETKVWNPAFDRTPVHLVTALITEKGVFSREELSSKILERHLI